MGKASRLMGLLGAFLIIVRISYSVAGMYLLIWSPWKITSAFMMLSLVFLIFRVLKSIRRVRTLFNKMLFKIVVMYLCPILMLEYEFRLFTHQIPDEFDNSFMVFVSLIHDSFTIARSHSHRSWWIVGFVLRHVLDQSIFT